MKYIDLNKLSQKAVEINWEATAQGHINAMRGISAKEKKSYLKLNRDWNLLQPAMMELSNNKCWYSESPGGNNDFSVEHFRPKNRAVYAEDYLNPDSPIVITKKSGYWWAAYKVENLRLSGTYSNLRRRDRLNPKAGVKGKGNYFPLDLNDVGRIANDEENLSCEIPILLDPTVAEDVSLLTFDENGEVISAAENDYEHNRVLQSIFYYHLDLDQLNTERVIAWKDCEREIKAAKFAIDNAPDERARRMVVANSLYNIREYVKDPNRSYSAVVKACVTVYSELDGYNIWLKRFVRANLI